MPVCNSIFDRESAADCFNEMMTLPRVASGRCKVAAIGMRLDARTRSAEVLETWARGLKLPFIGVLREAQAYVRCIEQGLTVFDLPDAQAQADTAQWKPIVAWLEPVLRTVHRPVLRGNPSVERPDPAHGGGAIRPGRARRCRCRRDAVPGGPDAGGQRRRPSRAGTRRRRCRSRSSPPTPPRPTVAEPAPRSAPVRLGLLGWLDRAALPAPLAFGRRPGSAWRRMRPPPC